MDDYLKLIGRSEPIFHADISLNEDKISKVISASRFLVLGGAGSIGQAVTKEIFKRNPLSLDVVDISENNLVELVRDIRSSFGYIDGEFRTFSLDIGSIEFDAFLKNSSKYDYILNLSALKHVRSEKDPFTLMRMIDVNITNTEKTMLQAIKYESKKYFCVSTDKAANPVNMMGASKRIMEMFLMRRSLEIEISTARFANVAFSDGSLLHSFNQRILKRQPIVAPSDIKRYFVTPEESGQLCLMSCLFGENRDIFFPKLSSDVHLSSFADIAKRYLLDRGYEPYICKTENEARELVKTLPDEGKWPCLFTISDTTGEKYCEEFFTDNEDLDTTRYEDIGVIKNDADFDPNLLLMFENKISELKGSECWDKKDILDIFFEILPEFKHEEKGKNLDGKM